MNVLRGNAGKRRPRVLVSRNSPSPRAPPDNFAPKNFFSKGSEAPSWLPDDAKCLWRELLPSVRRENELQRSGLIIFAAYCDALYRLQKFSREIEDKGVTYATKSGNMRKRPEVDMRNSAANAVHSLANELNLTTRSRINATATFVGGRLDLNWTDGDDLAR